MVQTLTWILCVLLGIALVAGGIWLALRKRKAPPPPSPPQPPTRSPVTSTPPTPPAPTTTTPKTNWVWPVIVGMLAIVVVIWVIAPMMTKEATAPAPKVAAPKRKVVVERPLEFVGGAEAFRKQDKIGVRKGGYADFEINFPFRENSRYQVVFQIVCNSASEHHLKIDSWPSEIFHFRQSKIGQPESVVFFGNVDRGGRRGEPRFFRPGKVSFRLWSDDDIVVLSSHIELIYFE